MSRRIALQLLHSAYAQQTPLWTGPVLQSISQTGESGRSGGSIDMLFAPTTAQGLALRDIRSQNPDSTWNNCTLCCREAPPFEVSTDGGKNWTTVPRNSVLINGTSITLLVDAPPDSPLGVRYGWRHQRSTLRHIANLNNLSP
jgi:hypothetical protein